MIDRIESLKKPLSELASVLNAFKSEAVQLRILEYLVAKEFGGEENEHSASEKRSRGRKRQAAKQQDEGGATATRRKKGTTGGGAVATLTQLVAGNFFEKPRTINDLIEYCKHNLAKTFKANEFSGSLARMVRSGQLSRKKNAKKQYEYKKS
jgi:hypothetical protein